MESLAPIPAIQSSVAQSATPDLAYILAVSFSGSTLLAMLLGSQPEAITVGEMRALTHSDPETYLCSCGEHIRKCSFWSEVSRRMARRGIPDFDITQAQLSVHDVDNPYLRRLLKPLPRGPLLETVRNAALALSPAWKPHLRNVHRRNGVLVDVLREITGTRLVVDSSKIATHLKFLLKSSDLKIKVIWLVRDGRAVANSMLRHGTSTMAEAAISWRRNNEAAELVLAGLPASQWLHVVYEELCREPEQTLRAICRFLDMDARQVVLDFRSRQQHVLGNDMRLKSGSDIRLDERWRTDLTREDLAAFENVAGELNRKYGYQ